MDAKETCVLHAVGSGEERVIGTRLSFTRRVVAQSLLGDVLGH